MTDDQQGKLLLVQDPARLDDVELKHTRVRKFLANVKADALLLQDPASIAWFTAGADLHRCGSEDCATSLFITPEARLFATNAVDSAQIFEREAFGLGFQLKQREWYQPHSELIADLCRGRNVVSDRGVKSAGTARRAIQQLRLPLTNLEVDRVRRLAKVAVHAVEASGHNLRRGATEAEVAGEVSHRLLKRTVAAHRINVCADGRNERYRHWTFSEQPIENYAVISCVARRWGLHVAVTRTVCLGSVSAKLLDAYRKAALVHATGMFFSRNGESLGNVWKKVHRIYEKFGVGKEWQLADQAHVTGYLAGEVQLRPNSDYTIKSPTPLSWHPSVGPAMLGDTLLVGETSNEVLTLSSTWPVVSISVKGREVVCPGILLLDRNMPVPRVDNVVTPSGFDCPDHPDEALPDAVESIWEMRVPSPDDTWTENESGVTQESAAE